MCRMFRKNILVSLFLFLISGFIFGLFISIKVHAVEIQIHYQYLPYLRTYIASIIGSRHQNNKNYLHFLV